MYKHFFKRFLDFWISLIALIIISPILLVITIWLHFANKGAGVFFFQDTPCKIEYQGATLKEYPIGMMSVLGRKIAYSGGGYFRLIPYWLTSKTMSRRDYDICYFHLNDLIADKRKLMSREDYEEYFMQPGTFKNRLIRFLKSNAKSGDTFEKLIRLLSEHHFVNIHEADSQIDWTTINTIQLCSL